MFARSIQTPTVILRSPSLRSRKASTTRDLVWRPREPQRDDTTSAFIRMTLERPSKIVCIGRNYAEHAKELGNDTPKEPLFFLKPPSSIVESGDAIELPKQSKQVEHEGE